LAAQSGVQLQVLDPMDNALGGTVYDENGDIQISGGSKGAKAWYAEMDEELQQEWNALVEGEAGMAIEDAAIQMKNGKLVKRDSIQGVRVGSAGGWTLEVFPGDFVVHR
jgi:hypothetical protein